MFRDSDDNTNPGFDNEDHLISRESYLESIQKYEQNLVTNFIRYEGETYTWKRGKDGYLFKYKGKKSDGKYAFYIQDDLYMFHENLKKIFIFHDYRNAEGQAEKPAPFIEGIPSNLAFWRHSEDGLYFYKNHQRVLNLSNTYQKDDLIIFDPSSNFLFKLENYRNIIDQQLRVCGILTHLNTNMNIWKGDTTGYYFFQKGKRKKGGTNKYQGDDLILTFDDGEQFLFKNYRNSKDSILREAIQLKSI